MSSLLRGFSYAAVFFAAVSLLAPLPMRSFAADAASTSSSSVKALSLSELEHGIADRLKRVEEFKFIQEEAARLGVRAWLFGGTAAGYAHYVKWDMLREKSDQRYQPARFDYDYTNIYRSTQDLDIVIDGNAEQAQRLQSALQQKYPHLQGSKTAWEVRLLTQDMGDKQAILNNPDFMNQHTDSNSTGMVELTKPKAGELVVRDVRDWKSKEPYFLKDVHDSALHYYFSPLHDSTKFAKEGRNPPILSVIRFLTKAFQYELKIRSEDLAQIKKIIDAFDPKQDTQNAYVANWIEKNGKKLFQNAVNIEYAWNTLEQLGLRKKLETIKANPSSIDSLAWWMNKEPLRTQAIGQGTGRTAKELELDIVAHETNNFLAYESITRAHTGDSNVLISRDAAAGELAIHGDGFYTKMGRDGARSSGLTIRFHLDPNAREGTDFVWLEKENYVIVLNKATLTVIPESLNIGPVEYFKMLAQSENGLNASDRGILEKLSRRVKAKTQALTAQESKDIAEIVKSAIDHPTKNHSRLFDDWFDLPISRSYSEISEKLVKKAAEDITLAKYLLSSRHWSDRTDWVGPTTLKNAAKDPDIATGIFRHIRKNSEDHREWIEFLLNEGTMDEWITSFLKDHPEWVEIILKRGKADYRIVYDVLSDEHWKDHPEWVERLIKKGSVDKELIERVLSKEHWKNHPEWVEAYLEKGTFDQEIAAHVLSRSHWSDRSDWVERLLKKGSADEEIARSVVSKSHWKYRSEWFETLLKRNNSRVLADLAAYAFSDPHSVEHPEWVEALLKLNNSSVDHSLAGRALTYPHWKDHPEWIEALLKRRIYNKYTLEQLLSETHWKDHPELRRLSGGKVPTFENLRAAFDRGESVKVTISPGACVTQRLDQLLK